MHLNIIYKMSTNHKILFEKNLSNTKILFVKMQKAHPSIIKGFYLFYY